MTTMVEPSPASQRGVVRWAARYDLLLWLLTLGRERAFRERLLAPAHLQPGESVLDVGCGTGTLAIVASRHTTAEVHGVDASPEMVARARAKARRAGSAAAFDVARAESLPFADARFDVALSTVMLHHLPRATRLAAVREMGRVLKPTGRLLVVDFAGARGGKGPRLHFHRHGHVDPRRLVELANEAGLDVRESGPLGRWSLHWVLAAPRA